MAGVVVGIPALILIPASLLALAAHLDTVRSSIWTSRLADDYSHAMLFVIVLGLLLAGASMSVQFVAWLGAIRNARVLSDKRWLNALLFVGIAGIISTPLCGLGLLISANLMIAYIAAGPDGISAEGRPASVPTKATIKMWMNWAIAAMASGTLFSLLIANSTQTGRLLHGLVWPSLALEWFGLAVAGLGVLGAAVAWWGALFNTQSLADKSWFYLLLRCGIVGILISPLLGLGAIIGLGVMIAYLRDGPDGTVGQPL